MTATDDDLPSGFADVPLTDAQQDDLELLLAGILTPAQVHITDEITDEGTSRARLVDTEGAPLATCDQQGRLRRLGDRAPRPFESLYRMPKDVGLGSADDRLIAAVDRPLTDGDLADLTAAAAGRPILLLALVGDGTPVETTPIGLIRATLAAATMLSHDDRTSACHVIAVPLSHHPGAPMNAERRAAVTVAYAHDPVGSTVIEPSHNGAVPERIAGAVAVDRPRGAAQGGVILFSGLSGSGKSTVAQAVRNRLLESGARAVTLLDGDMVRRHLSAGLGFSRADRDTNIRRIGWVAAEIARHGGMAIASPIAPFDETRQAVRRMVTDAGGVFVLVHIATPLAECERRDRKGLYARARAGEIAEFTGISSPYEAPDDAELTIDTSDVTVDDAAKTVLTELRGRGLNR